MRLGRVEVEGVLLILDGVLDEFVLTFGASARVLARKYWLLLLEFAVLPNLPAVSAFPVRVVEGLLVAVRC